MLHMGKLNNERWIKQTDIDELYSAVMDHDKYIRELMRIVQLQLFDYERVDETYSEQLHESVKFMNLCKDEINKRKGCSVNAYHFDNGITIEKVV